MLSNFTVPYLSQSPVVSAIPTFGADATEVRARTFVALSDWAYSTNKLQLALSYGWRSDIISPPTTLKGATSYTQARYSPPSSTKARPMYYAKLVIAPPSHYPTYHVFGKILTLPKVYLSLEPLSS